MAFLSIKYIWAGVFGLWRGWARDVKRANRNANMFCDYNYVFTKMIDFDMVTVC